MLDLCLLCHFSWYPLGKNQEAVTVDKDRRTRHQCNPILTWLDVQVIILSMIVWVDNLLPNDLIRQFIAKYIEIDDITLLQVLDVIEINLVG